jgi:hypothetical protein
VYAEVGEEEELLCLNEGIDVEGEGRGSVCEIEPCESQYVVVDQ